MNVAKITKTIEVTKNVVVTLTKEEADALRDYVAKAKLDEVTNAQYDILTKLYKELNQ